MEAGGSLRQLTLLPQVPSTCNQPPGLNGSSPLHSATGHPISNGYSVLKCCGLGVEPVIIGHSFFARTRACRRIPVLFSG